MVEVPANSAGPRRWTRTHTDGDLHQAGPGGEKRADGADI